jgi:hypothetical protein
MGKEYDAMNSPVCGNFRTIGSILSHAIFAPCFHFDLIDNGE